jgi:thioester reductase-like protein
VLVTGATGRLGAELLPAWRVHDDRRVIALVRRPSEALRARLGVELLAGDLAMPRLGLSEATWAELAVELGAIVHAGAMIQLHGDWAAHAPINVGGTAEIVRLAAEAGAALHHVSTLSVFVATDRGERHHRETAVPDADACAFGGYAQTKIAAEALARAGRGREAPTTVFRLGLLVGGAPRAEDQLGMAIRGLARLGSVPAGSDELRFDLTPIDFATRAIAQLALAAECDGADRTHHIAGARSATLGGLADAMRACGTALAELPAAVWAERARAQLADPDITMAYLALGRAHADPALYARLRRYDLFLATGADFEVAATHAQVGVPAHDLDAIVAGALELA